MHRQSPVGVESGTVGRYHGMGILECLERRVNLNTGVLDTKNKRKRTRDRKIWKLSDKVKELITVAASIRSKSQRKKALKQLVVV
jgi:hypothetical protein